MNDSTPLPTSKEASSTSRSGSPPIASLISTETLTPQRITPSRYNGYPRASSTLLTRQFQLNAVEETRRKHAENLELQNELLKQNLDYLKEKEVRDIQTSIILLELYRALKGEKENVPPVIEEKKEVPSATRRSKRLSKKAKTNYRQ